MAEDFSWHTADNLEIHARAWPVASPRAVLGLIHGQGEHIQRYEHLAQWFNQRGVAVLGYDRRGHGRSQGKRGHAPSTEAFLDEIGQLTAELESRYPGRPVFLYGHSGGGNLLLHYLLQRHPTLTGAIVSAPYIRLVFKPSPLKVSMVRLLHGLVPSLTAPSGLPADQLSRDPEVVRLYKNDPLVHDKLSLSAAISAIEAAAFLDKYQGELTIPLLLMHGGEDAITDPAATRELADRLAGDVTLKIWDGLYHEIHNEPEQEEVFGFTWSWMEKVMSSDGKLA